MWKPTQHSKPVQIHMSNSLVYISYPKNSTIFPPLHLHLSLYKHFNIKTAAWVTAKTSLYNPHALLILTELLKGKTSLYYSRVKTTHHITSTKIQISRFYLVKKNCKKLSTLFLTYSLFSLWIRIDSTTVANEFHQIQYKIYIIWSDSYQFYSIIINMIKKIC